MPVYVYECAPELVGLDQVERLRLTVDRHRRSVIDPSYLASAGAATKNLASMGGEQLAGVGVLAEAVRG